MQRRGLLAGTGAALALSGCATYGDTSGGAATGTTPAQSAGAVLGHTGDIPVGGGKVYADQKVVVTQPESGTFKCFTAICTHAGCTVGDVKGGTINCPCHGSKYKIADGSVAAGPAPKPLAPVAIGVDGDSIKLA